MILLDLSHDSLENEVLFVTIGPLPKALDPNCPKLVFRPQIPNVRVLGSENIFMSNGIKCCIK